MNKNLSQSILKKIKTDHVEPKSRGYFLFYRALLWLPGIISIIVGALAISVILFSITHSGWRYSEFTHTSLLTTIMDTLPYLWIFFAAIFGFLAIKFFRKTKTGYRYKAASLILASLLVSVVIGVVSYTAGIGKYLDTQLSPRSTLEHQQALWSDPLVGRLGGDVKKISDDNIRIRDFDGYLWNVDITDVSRRETAIFNTITDRHKQIRVLGYIDETFVNTFHACVILPLQAPARGDELRRQPIPRDAIETLSDKCKESVMLPTR